MNASHTGSFSVDPPSLASEGGVRFLQQRLGLFGLVGSVVGGVLLAFRTVARIATSQPDPLLHPSMILHLLGSLVLLAAWVLCRKGPKSRRSVERIETVVLLASASVYAAMIVLTPAVDYPVLAALPFLTLGVMARAVLVPSTPGRTAFLVVLTSAPVLAVAFLAHAPPPPGESDSTRIAVAVSVAIWWVLSAVLATVTSHVIYGLRREAREARLLGSYVLEEKIGQGGMGVVYRARHASLRRPAAVKLLPASKAGEQALARFEREVRLTARLSHPNTVTVFDYGRTPDGIFYYAMELLDGATVEQIVEHDGAQPVARVLHVLVAMAGALAEAHDVGLIHRDIKPANVMLCRHGGEVDVPKLLDFGLVKDLVASAGPSITGANTITGTPLYLAPEAVLSPRGVDLRSDLYALGAVGYFMLTGTHVFDGDSVVEVCGQHLHEAPEPPGDRLGKPVPEDFAGILLDCLAKNPEDRPQSARALKQRLQACLCPSPWGVEEALAWWEASEPWLRREPSERQPVSQSTLDVDLGRRSRVSLFPALAGASCPAPPASHRLLR
jgi:serine/threonine protein kinase